VMPIAIDFDQAGPSVVEHNGQLFMFTQGVFGRSIQPGAQV